MEAHPFSMEAPLEDDLQELEEIALEDDEEEENDGVDGRNLSDGTITTLLAASQFDGQGFYLSGCEFQEITATGANEETQKDSNNEGDPAVKEEDHHPQSHGAVSDSHEGTSPTPSDVALKRAYSEVVRTLKRDRESRPASRNVSQEDANAINNFFAMVEMEDANKNNEDEASAQNEGGDDQFLPPPEEQLKPHLEQIQIRVEPDSLGSW
jgi:hypothetical protein